MFLGYLVHPLTFSLSVPLNLKYISCKQHSNWVLLFYPHLTISIFNWVLFCPFIYNVIIHKVRFKSTILLFICCLLCCLVYCLFFSVSCFNQVYCISSNSLLAVFLHITILVATQVFILIKLQ